jgi:hypothetical protein
VTEQGDVPDPVRMKYQDAYGADMGGLMHALWNETAWLYVLWHQYEELFGAKESRVEILNRAAPFFFRVMQDVLWDQTLLGIARLVDPSESPGKGRRQNLTVRGLPIHIVDRSLREEVENLCSIAKEKAGFAVDWRNRRIAHRDLNVTLESQANPLEPASRLKVREAMDAIAAVTQHIDLRVRQNNLIYDWADHPGDALSVLKRLRDGLAWREEYFERKKRGELQPDELNPSRDI